VKQALARFAAHANHQYDLLALHLREFRLLPVHT
jgi:hypothetical protein